MASVYEAVHVGLGKRVALKVLRPHLAVDETTIARFVREGRAVAKVRHPHVIDVFDVGAHDELPYLVMELLEGLDLSEYLKRNAPLTADETIGLILPVISAVAAAHDAGIVHRDLKPANIFLSAGRHGKVHPKVVDFGISTFTEKDGDLELTHTQTMLGTVRYMSPEQTRGAKYADARSDQYAVGVILYLCTTGVVPFEGEGVYEIIHAIRHGELQPPSVRAPALSPAFDAVVTRALAREPAARFDSVAELGRELMKLATRRSITWEREFATGEAVTRSFPAAAFDDSATHDVPMESGAVVRLARPRVARSAVALLLAAVLGAGAVALVRSPRADRGPATTPSSAAAPDERAAAAAAPDERAAAAAAPDERVAAAAAPDERVAAAPAPQGAADGVASGAPGGAAPDARAAATAPLSRRDGVPLGASMTRPKPAARGGARPDPPRKPRPRTGSNGAPILE